MKRSEKLEGNWVKIFTNLIKELIMQGFKKSCFVKIDIINDGLPLCVWVCSNNKEFHWFSNFFLFNLMTHSFTSLFLLSSTVSSRDIFISIKLVLDIRRYFKLLYDATWMEFLQYIFFLFHFAPNDSSSQLI